MRGGFELSIDISVQYDKIYKYCYFKVGNCTVAQDLTQETFLKYLSQTQTPRITHSKPLAYLYTIAKNLCIDYYRTPKTESLDNAYDDITDDTISPLPHPQTIKQISDFETNYSLQQALNTLPTDEQELLLLRYANELQINEISAITNTSRFAVSRKIKTALSHLKQILNKEDFNE